MFNKLNPKTIFSTLKMFGINVNDILPKLEDLIIKEADKLELATGKPLFLVATKQGENITVSLFLQEQDETLTLYKSFPFSQLLNELNKNINDDNTTNIEIEPAATDSTNTAADPGASE